ncbi:MAG TPA: AMMECR1 domain-containing protein [bacterium]|nr:AMMECR1 domain-containing protein [bacterium]HOM26427.1 AMMECR1 domain-containing protein [bacterium]
MFLVFRKIFKNFGKIITILIFLFISITNSQIDLKLEALKLSRETLITYLKTNRIPEVNSILNSIPSKSIFITLTKNGKTRGCAGSFIPIYNSLGESVINFTIIAATQDIRYNPVKIEEIDEIIITITFPERTVCIENPYMIKPLKEGLIIRKDGKEGVVLPGEAKTVEYAIKIGLRNANLNNLNGAIFYKFNGSSFSEKDLKYEKN